MSVEIQADQFKKHSVTKINRASWWIKYGSEAIMFPGNRLLTDYCGGCLPRSSLEVNTCKRERTKGGLGEGRSWAVIQSQQRPQSDPGGAVNVFQSFSVVLCSWLGGLNFYTSLLIIHWMRDAPKREHNLGWATFFNSGNPWRGWQLKAVF